MQSIHLCTINHNDKVVECSKKKGNINRTELKHTEKILETAEFFFLKRTF
jgi:hypothetical protein